MKSPRLYLWDVNKTDTSVFGADTLRGTDYGRIQELWHAACQGDEKIEGRPESLL